MQSVSRQSGGIVSGARRFIALALLVLAATWVGAQTPIPSLSMGGSAGAPHGRQRPTVALVLSGGSAFGMAHVGVIKVLEEAGIPIDMIMGTSMGSIVSGLYAAGYTPAQMEAIVTQLDWNSVFMDGSASADDLYDFQKKTGYMGRLGLNESGLVIGEGLFSGQNVLALFTELTLHRLGTRRFDDFPVPYRAVAADIWNGDKIVFSGGSLAEAMRSSMSIPGVFKPYKTGGKTLVDGGIVDNLPVDIAKDMGADIVIAVESRGASPRSPDALTSALSIAGQTFDLFISQNMRPNRDRADFLIVPDLAAFTTASYGEAEAIIDQGEKKARQLLPEIKALAEKIRAVRPLVTPAQQPNRAAMTEPPRIARVRVEGAVDGKRGGVERAFARFEGVVPDRKALRAAVDTVYASGDYDLVKVDLEPYGEEDTTLVVSCVPSSRPGNALLLNMDLDGIVSKGSSVDSELSAGILLRSLTTPSSALFGKVALGSGLKGYAEFFQPFGAFYLMPWIRYSLDYDGWIFEEYKIASQYKNYGGGLWTGLALGSRTDLRVGLSYEIVKDASYTVGGKVPDRRSAALRAAFRTDLRSSTVYPERGISFMLYGVWSDDTYVGEIPFAKLEMDFEAALPLGRGFTLGFAGYAGSDFSLFIPAAQAAPSSQYFSITRQGLFYGLAPEDLYAQGHTVAALGLELRRKVGMLNPLVGGDLYLLANASVGTASQRYIDDATDDYDFFPLRWSATVGAGLKLSDQFGLFAGAGVVSAGGEIRPALSVSFGSFEDRIEDKR